MYIQVAPFYSTVNIDDTVQSVTEDFMFCKDLAVA